MICTTLNRIREHKPCQDDWEKLLNHLGKTQADDEPLPYSVIVESNGLDDALWCCRAEPQYAKEWRLFAVWCARQVQYLMIDKRSLDAIDVAEKFANGLATEVELTSVQKAAWAATEDVAEEAVWEFAWTAAEVTAEDATGDVAWDTARAAARVATGVAVRDAIKALQTKKFLEIVGGESCTTKC